MVKVKQERFDIEEVPMGQREMDAQMLWRDVFHKVYDDSRCIEGSIEDANRVVLAFLKNFPIRSRSQSLSLAEVLHAVEHHKEWAKPPKRDVISDEYITTLLTDEKARRQVSDVATNWSSPDE